MNLRYSTRTRFFEAIADALEVHGSCPEQDRPVTVELSPEGYGGSILIEITPDLPDEFRSDWERADETRFPVRIRAAATVLRDQRCYGKYLISHDHGVLTITRG